MLTVIWISARNCSAGKKEPSKGDDSISNYSDFGIRLPENYQIHGIDISKHQKDIDWDAVSKMRADARKISFVFIKATEGATRADDEFCTNWEQAKEHNLLRGAYHFYRPARTPEEQATMFFSKVELEKGDLPPVVDFEHTNHRSKADIQYGLTRFLKILEKKYQVKPIIYTNLSFYKNYIKGRFDNYPIWIACYWGEDMIKSVNCKWQFWQHSSVGKVNGIQGEVDFNVFKGSLDDLKNMCIK